MADNICAKYTNVLAPSFRNSSKIWNPIFRSISLSQSRFLGFISNRNNMADMARVKYGHLLTNWWKFSAACVRRSLLGAAGSAGGGGHTRRSHVFICRCGNMLVWIHTVYCLHLCVAPERGLIRSPSAGSSKCYNPICCKANWAVKLWRLFLGRGGFIINRFALNHFPHPCFCLLFFLILFIWKQKL